MDKQLLAMKAIWEQIDGHIKESPLLIMLADENSIHDIDYGKYLKHGYSHGDVSIGFELIRAYKLLKSYVKNIFSFQM